MTLTSTVKPSWPSTITCTWRPKIALAGDVEPTDQERTTDSGYLCIGPRCWAERYGITNGWRGLGFAGLHGLVAWGGRLRSNVQANKHETRNCTRVDGSNHECSPASEVATATVKPLCRRVSCRVARRQHSCWQSYRPRGSHRTPHSTWCQAWASCQKWCPPLLTSRRGSLLVSLTTTGRGHGAWACYWCHWQGTGLVGVGLGGA